MIHPITMIQNQIQVRSMAIRLGMREIAEAIELSLSSKGVTLTDSPEGTTWKIK